MMATMYCCCCLQIDPKTSGIKKRIKIIFWKWYRNHGIKTGIASYQNILNGTQPRCFLGMWDLLSICGLAAAAARLAWPLRLSSRSSSNNENDWSHLTRGQMQCAHDRSKTLKSGQSAAYKRHNRNVYGVVLRSRYLSPPAGGRPQGSQRSDIQRLAQQRC